jgi:hypothetical protein
MDETLANNTAANAAVSSISSTSAAVLKAIKRKEKPLPPALELLTEADIDKLVIGQEMDDPNKTKSPGPYDVAISVRVTETKDGVDVLVDYDIKSLNTNQVRSLCKRFGVASYSSKRVFICRRMLAQKQVQCAKLEEAVAFDTATAESKKLNTALRIINALFCSAFLPKFLAINDKKGRPDHELGRSTPKTIYKDISEYVNSEEPDEVLDKLNVSILSDNNLHLLDETLYGCVDLTTILPVSCDGKVVQNLVSKLIKIRHHVQDMMRTSGTHDSDPLLFIDVGKKRAKVTGVHKLAAYYFIVNAN